MNLNKYYEIKGTNFSLRYINYTDYSKDYLFLLKQLTVVEPENINQREFNYFLDTLNAKHNIIVVENLDTKKIVGTITFFIEYKMIHNMGSVCHIEDVVVDSEFRGYGIGKEMIETAIEYSKQVNCYKTILDCSDKNVEFYKKNGKFEINGNYMVLYHH